MDMPTVGREADETRLVMIFVMTDARVETRVARLSVTTEYGCTRGIHATAKRSNRVKWCLSSE